MKKNSKKRVLLSSVAMLMVGTISLGTATFAWFTNNKTVVADGMKVTSSAAKGLQITGKNGIGGNVQDTNWGPKYTFNTTAMLQPISVNYSDASGKYAKITDGWYPADVKVTGAYTNETKTNFSGWTKNTAYPEVVETVGTEAVGSNGFFLAYEVGLRSTGDDIDGVKLQVNIKDGATGEKGSEYMRVAILDQKANTTQSYNSDEIEMVVGKETSPNAVSEVKKTGSGADTVETVTLVNQKLVKGGADNEVVIGKVTQTPQYYTILVWFEGQDGECVDDFTNAEGLIDVKFYYTNP
jgi:hypothetical protein